MKKKILACILVVVLASTMVLALAGCSCNNDKKDPVSNIPKGVKGISSTPNNTSGVKLIVYRVGITEDTDWNAMPKADKEKIIDYTFKEIYRMNAEDSVKYWSVLGVHDGSGEVLFGYDREKDEMILYKNQEEDYRIPAPKNTTPAK